MFNGPPLNITVSPLVLSNKHFQYLINTIPALPVTVIAYLFTQMR